MVYFEKEEELTLSSMPQKEKEYTEGINVFFTKEQLDDLKQEAEKCGLPISVYVRMIVMREIQRTNRERQVKKIETWIARLEEKRDEFVADGKFTNSEITIMLEAFYEKLKELTNED